MTNTLGADHPKQTGNTTQPEKLTMLAPVVFMHTCSCQWRQEQRQRLQAWHSHKGIYGEACSRCGCQASHRCGGKACGSRGCVSRAQQRQQGMRLPCPQLPNTGHVLASEVRCKRAAALCGAHAPHGLISLAPVTAARLLTYWVAFLGGGGPSCAQCIQCGVAVHMLVLLLPMCKAQWGALPLMVAPSHMCLCNSGSAGCC